MNAQHILCLIQKYNGFHMGKVITFTEQRSTDDHNQLYSVKRTDRCFNI